jgi:hypothetical protein
MNSVWLHLTDNFANQVGYIANQTNQERVQVQGIENALNDRNQVAQSYDELEVDIYISDRDVDLLHGNLDSGVNRDEACDLGVEVEICLKPLYIQFDAANMEFRDTEKYIGR